MQKIIPHLWFDQKAEVAADFYTSVFKAGRVLNKTHYTKAGRDIHGMEAGSVMTVEFEIGGHQMIALNGGPIFTPNPSISFFVYRKTKEEIDELWKALSDGGTPLMPLETYPFSPYYGWIQDKFGVSWQLIIWEQDGDIPPVMPSLMFIGNNDGKADEAIDFYISVFKNSSRGQTARYGDMPGDAVFPAEHIAYADFTLEGQKFVAMDSGKDHKFNFNEGISLMVIGKDQAEIDYYWDKLSAVPEAEQCGWLKDKFGVSWQVVPAGMEKILNDPDQDKAERGMAAVLKMKKIDIEELRRALVN